MTGFSLGFGLTDAGRVRAVNQDSPLVVDDRLFALADGMGGHQGGEVAAEVALDRPGRELTEPTDRRSARCASSRPTAGSTKAGDDAELTGMGTTLCAVALVEPTTGRAARRGQRGRFPGLRRRRRRADSSSPTITASWPTWSARAVSPRKRPPSTPNATCSPGRWASTPTSRSTGARSTLRHRRSLPALQRRSVQRGRARTGSRRCSAGWTIRPRPRQELVRLANRARWSRQHHRASWSTSWTGRPWTACHPWGPTRVTDLHPVVPAPARSRRRRCRCSAADEAGGTDVAVQRRRRRPASTADAARSESRPSPR